MGPEWVSERKVPVVQWKESEAVGHAVIILYHPYLPMCTVPPSTHQCIPHLVQLSQLVSFSENMLSAHVISEPISLFVTRFTPAA